LSALPDLEGRWPDATGYLLNHSVGLPPRSAARAVSEALFSPWRPDDDQVWPHWLAALERFRSLLARVINSDASLVCPQPSVSSALSQILGALPVDPRRKRLLIAERAFPSLGFVFKMAERRGFELHMVPRDADTLDPESWAEYLDDRVHCVLFTHVHSNTGECHELAPLCDLARNRGVISVVDVAQSIGIRRVDAARWNADFIVGSCIKWLCGGSGAGFLWVNEQRLSESEPIDVGWFSHEDPFEFDIHSFRYAPDALRFLGGTPSVAPAIVAGHSIGALLDLGLERIEAHNRELTQFLLDALPAAPVVSPAEPASRGGSLILQFGDRQSAVVERLRAAGFQFDERREGIRISPHFYNTRQDMERLTSG